MTGLTTLLWLEMRKHGLLILLLWLGVGAWYLLAGQLLNAVRRESGSSEAALAVLFATLGLTIGGTMTFLAFQGVDFAREHRVGRLSLLLGSPLAGWVHILARVLVCLVFLSVFLWGMWWVMAFWLAKVGVMVPMGMASKVWLYGLGGLPLVVFALFIGLMSAAFLSRRTSAIAGFVAFAGVVQLLDYASQGIGRWLYTLPAWKLPAPRVAGSPQIQLGWALFPGLPGEGFLLLLGLSAVLFFLLSRIWNEVEA